MTLLDPTRGRPDLIASDRRQLQLTALVAVVAVLLAGGLYLVLRTPSRMVTAYFSSATGVFEDSAVRVLGVPVGDIVEVAPEGTRVRVELRIDDPDLKLPADAKAVVVSPSLVTGRYVQLTPTWSGGPELESGAVIPLERTAVPLDVDDLARTATELADALGPNGANSQGALSDALDVGAANLDGNGQALNDTVRNLGELSGTLADSREELFGTVTELQSFVSNLSARDGEVREFNTRLESVAGQLADERGDLGTSVRELSFALDDVAGFVRDNRDLVHSDVDKLNEVSGALVEQRKALAEVLDVAPAALGNLSLSYNGSAGTLDTRALVNELSLPFPVLACELVHRGTPEQLPPTLGQACNTLLGGLQDAPLPSAAEVITSLQAGQLPPVPGLALPVDPAPAGTAVPGLPGLPIAPPGAPTTDTGSSASATPSAPAGPGRAPAAGSEKTPEKTAEPKGSERSRDAEKKEDSDSGSDRGGGLLDVFGGGDR